MSAHGKRPAPWLTGYLDQKGNPARQIRDATPADAAMLCASERAIVAQFDGLLVSVPEELREESFLERINLLAASQGGNDKSGGNGKYLIAQVNGQPVAHACLWPLGLRKVSHVLRLDMCVHLGFWRQGHGEALLRALMDWAAQQTDFKKIELLVRAENLPALALYQKLGFVVEGRMRQRIRLNSGRLVDDISMAYFLHPLPAAIGQ